MPRRSAAAPHHPAPRSAYRLRTQGDGHQRKIHLKPQDRIFAIVGLAGLIEEGIGKAQALQSQVISQVQRHLLVDVIAQFSSAYSS